MLAVMAKPATRKAMIFFMAALPIPKAKEKIPLLVDVLNGTAYCV